MWKWLTRCHCALEGDRVLTIWPARWAGLLLTSLTVTTLVVLGHAAVTTRRPEIFLCALGVGAGLFFAHRACYRPLVVHREAPPPRFPRLGIDPTPIRKFLRYGSLSVPLDEVPPGITQEGSRLTVVWARWPLVVQLLAMPAMGLIVWFELKTWWTSVFLAWVVFSVILDLLNARRWARALSGRAHYDLLPEGGWSYQGQRYSGPRQSWMFGPADPISAEWLDARLRAAG